MKKKYLLLLLILFFVVALDQATKIWILNHYSLHESFTVIKGFFSITYVRNPGAAFGLLNTAPPNFRIPFFIAIPIIALVAILFVLKRVDDDDHFLSTALSLVIGGAIGNLIDRIAYNYVVDFLLFYWKEGGPEFPAFNVADTAISVGVGLLILDIFRKEKQLKNASNTFSHR